MNMQTGAVRSSRCRDRRRLIPVAAALTAVALVACGRAGDQANQANRVSPAPIIQMASAYWGSSILLTANYQTFNYLTLALLLFALDDGHLAIERQHLEPALPVHPGGDPAANGLQGLRQRARRLATGEGSSAWIRHSSAPG